ncbi:leucine-rich repeat domain-containing protein [Capnocytophaga cynodegmi]|uniref:hypothetical protein n=1 Tax=Capnocytophaga cynodegmi TaxID=28189 RepID=UPI00385B38C5
MNRILIIAFMLMTISMAYAQKEKDIVYIPDENFKRILLENKKINTNGDKEISYEEAKNCQGMIDVVNNNIKSLEGIEAFVNITMLYCEYNKLTSLDLSKNIALEVLYCFRNELTSLDVSKNIALSRLDCSNNELISLDVSKNIALNRLNCFSNQLTSLDVSNNMALNILDFSSNELTSLDVSKNMVLEQLRCRNNRLTSLDVSKNIALSKLYCEGNMLIGLDISKNKALETLNCSSNQLINLNLANGNNEKLDYIVLENNPDLKCIQIDKDFNPPPPTYHIGNLLKYNWIKDEDAKYSDTCE